MRVLIADDEMKVCNLIVQLIDWKAYDMEIVAVVHDGKAAYEAICELHPNIVITDIRMPNYDGIELIRQSKERFSDIYFIIISGYSHFSYAQNAIQYGVVDYLLKPLKKKELQATLDKIRQDYGFNVSSVKKRQEMESMVEKSKEKVKQNLLMRWKEISEDEEKIRKSSFEREEIDETNRQYQCNFVPGYYRAFIVHPYVNGGEKSNETMTFLLSKLRQLMIERLEDLCVELLTDVSNGELLCVINMETDDFSEIKKQINKTKLVIQNLREIFGKIQLTVGVGRNYSDINGVIQSIKEAKSALKDRMTEGKAFMIMYESKGEIPMRVDKQIGLNLRNKFWAFQECFDVKGLVGEIEGYLQGLGENPDGEAIYSGFFDLIDVLRSGMRNYGEEFSFCTVMEWEKKYKDIPDYKTLGAELINEINSSYSQYGEWKKNMESKPIRKVKQYIFEHYNEPIGLEEVSEQAGFNPAYFSTLFKKEVGKNFSEYIMELRIQNAKTFLAQTNKEISSIAELVGYSDFKYFSKLFKRITGLNPSEYRKLYG